MGFLAGKRLLITGLLSNRSIAYGIAKACHREGAELAFSYVGERFKDRITEFAKEFGTELVFDCDVGSDEQIDAMFKELAKTWPTFDGFVHSIGFAPREAIAGDFLEGLSRESFRIAHDISAYSFPAMAKAALPYLNPNAALLTLTYLALNASCRLTTPWAWPRPLWKPACATPPPASAPRASAPTAFRLARSRPWPPQASRGSARSSASWKKTRHCGATSRSKTSAMWLRSCCLTWQLASRPRSPMSTAASAT